MKGDFYLGGWASNDPAVVAALAWDMLSFKVKEKKLVTWMVAGLFDPLGTADIMTVKEKILLHELGICYLK